MVLDSNDLDTVEAPSQTGFDYRRWIVPPPSLESDLDHILVGMISIVACVLTYPYWFPVLGHPPPDYDTIQVVRAEDFHGVYLRSDPIPGALIPRVDRTTHGRHWRAGLDMTGIRLSCSWIRWL